MIFIFYYYTIISSINLVFYSRIFKYCGFLFSLKEIYFSKSNYKQSKKWFDTLISNNF